MPYLKFRHIVIAFLLILILTLWKCTSCTDSETASPSADTADEGIEITASAPDTAAYNLGCENARILHACNDRDRIRSLLLEMRARHTNILHRIGPASADSYLQGVKATLVQSSDTLANTLF